MSAAPAQNSARPRGGEIARLVLLGAGAAWLLHPFATGRQIGAGDALWYANMLADFVTQIRVGVFPVFAGQTEFAFNGAVYPLRVAPLYQHLAGLLDLLTARQLGWFALQHLCVIVAGVAGIFSCYFSLVSLVPERRWTAVGLATLYLSCPGILGTIYTQDLYMTWMTLPFAPLAVYGAVRAFQRDDLAAQLWLAAALAALWLAHSPIALWMTLLIAAFQLVRLFFVHRTAAAWRRAIIGGALFGALASYPFMSVAALRVPGSSSTIAGGLEHAERITNVVREVFPAVLLPVSEHARALSDLQLDYGLWGILLVAVSALVVARGATLGVLIAGCAFLFFLLLPLPGNDWLWANLPEQIKSITFYWPMHRFYLLLAALLAVAGQLAFFVWTKRSPRATKLLACTLVAACAWSLWESRQFIAAGRDRTASAETTALRQRPENLLLMNHAYGLFAALPAYFSNGTMDARAETRLLDRDTFAPIPDAAPNAALRPLHGRLDENPGILKFDPALHLVAGRRYELIFEFLPRAYTGVLQITGRRFFREYTLPASGEAQGFGTGEGHAHALPLWTTSPDGDDLVLRFIPTAAGERPADYTEFGRYALREIDPKTTAIDVTTLLPFRATVRATREAWLETPRMFQPGYIARVDGQTVEVLRSPRGLVMMPVAIGTHRADLEFRGPPTLRLSYWFSLGCWLALGMGATLAAALRRLKN